MIGVNMGRALNFHDLEPATSICRIAERSCGKHGAAALTWAWWICGLLMLATVVNYMDRQVLSVTAKRIKSDLDFNNRYYGWLETGFGIAFAAGQILLGFVSDRVNLRWFYPLLLALWSLVGFATGLMHSFTGLLVYFACCLLTACATFAAFLPAGPWLVGVLLLVGCGSLGSFPFYYALESGAQPDGIRDRSSA